METRRQNLIYSALLSVLKAAMASVIVFALATPPALAQAKSCVSLLDGAGYAAKMAVVSQEGDSDGTGSFPIGQTQCINLDDSSVQNGQVLNRSIHALAGESKTCEPQFVAGDTRNANGFVYQAWGKTLHVKCQQH
ncbi:hypothetical protein BJP36_00255 [Moorena producens JHB]|uniref:Uncharacterized protein n=1 Tax=Moorena producens (strain JHB) TaxID=1454205 RepID=A0A1D9FTB6_MOOP1|nr:hypothetical protein [Moorena producens]AOY78545.1 hypothetical protein BJP36_00255 [Moorena producens JHB]